MLPSPVLASDIYAVGSIGIQAMTGLPPSNINTPFEEIPRWWEVPDRINATPEFTEILNKMLAFSPKARYYDASTALEALRAITAKYSTTKQSVIVTPVFTQPPVVTQPSIESSVTNISQISTQPGLEGKLSQEIFTFETAKLTRVLVQKVEIVREPGCLNIGEKEDHQMKMVQEWQVEKFQAQAERFTEDLKDGVNLEMVYVPGGSFTMGSDGYDSEKPRHVVNVPSFYMGKFQVTQEQYLQIMGTNPAYWQGANLPVEMVSLYDAQEFCQRLSVKTGKRYRLPSEAEWEYACKAGTDTPFYFGETISTELANYDGNYIYGSGVKGVYREKTIAVGSFPANGFGLYDMHGNVWEWCRDTWQENYQGAPTDGRAWIIKETRLIYYTYNDYYLLRGGSWGTDPVYFRSTGRYRWSADYRNYNFGFRIICAEANNSKF
jgi:eukaryotic-like serine/threonine-protein kinase